MCFGRCMSQVNDPDTIRRLLTTPGRWAVVGLSRKKWRIAYSISLFLKKHGMEIIPVHPDAEEVHGSKGYRSLAEVPGDIDVVDIFVRSEYAGEVVDQAIAVGAKAVWMQQGVIDEAAAERAREAGLDVMMDTCPAIESSKMRL